VNKNTKLTTREKKNNRILVIFWIAVCIPLFTWIWFNRQNRLEELTNNSIDTVAIIEHLKPNQRKGTTTNKDVVYVFFQYQDKIIHEIDQISDGMIKKLDIKVGDRYPIKVSKADPNVFEISYKKEIDRIIELDMDLEHVYQSTRHRYLIK
jgi:hypothetical protein